MKNESIWIVLIALFLYQGLLGQTVTASVLTHASCNGYSDGQATASTSGGVIPYAYLWSPTGQTSAVATGLAAGVHSVISTDNVGATATASVTITEPPAITATIVSQTNVSCYGGSDGTATVSVTGGTPVYTWLWSDGQTIQTATGLSASVGIYCVTVSDASSCSDVACVTITEPSAISISTTSTPVTCVGNDGTATTAATGGVGGYTYDWGIGTSPTLTNLVAGLYPVTVTDVNGCTATAAEIVSGPIQSISNVSYLIAPDSSLSFCVLPSGATTSNILQNSIQGSLTANGVGCYTYTTTALPEVSDTLIIEACDGAAVVQNTIIIDIAGCVWAGDTDTNQVVNNFDLLPIGIHYGQIGMPRPNADLNWDCEPMWNWFPLASGQPDPKHADTNGDGIVNDADTLAITLNWGQLYLRNGGSVPQSGVPIYIDTITTTPGDTILLPVILGTSLMPALGAYGLAFTITYDNSMVDTNSVHMDYSNSWLGTNGVDMLTLEKDFYAQGEIEVALTRIDHTTLSGSGAIAHIQLTIKDDVLKRLNNRLDFGIKDVRLIDSVGNMLPVVPEASSVLILTTDIVRATNPTGMDFQLFPNPMQGAVSTLGIALTETTGSVNVSIHNALGQVLQNGTYQAQNRIAIDFDFEATPGIYFVMLKNEKGEVGVKKLTISR